MFLLCVALMLQTDRERAEAARISSSQENWNLLEQQPANMWVINEIPNLHSLCSLIYKNMFIFVRAGNSCEFMDKGYISTESLNTNV